MKNTSLIVSAVLWLCSCLSMMAAGNKVYVVQSPDKQLKVEISAGTDGLIYSVYHKDSLIVVDSKLGLIQEGKTPALAGGAKVISAKTKKIFQDIDAPFYRFKSFQAVCNEMNLKLKGEYGVYFRVYNEGVAYRFYTSSKEDLIIKNEIAEFRFAGNYTAYLPYSTNKEKPMAMAFQNTYEVKPLSEAIILIIGKYNGHFLYLAYKELRQADSKVSISRALSQGYSPFSFKFISLQTA